MAQLLDYYPAKYQVGNRYDVVKRVIVNTQIVDIDAPQVMIKLYKIPKDISWNSQDTGLLTYEYFQSLPPSALYSITLPKANSDYHGTPEFETDPAFFFSAENGIAYVLEAKTLIFFDVPSIKVEYKWEK